MARAPRRARCARCHQLVEMVVEHWPRGIGHQPREWVCPWCATELGITDDGRSQGSL